MTNAVRFANNAASTLSAGITNSATSLTVATGGGAKFPTLAGGDYFWVTLVGGGNMEIVKVTALATDTMTIVRAQQGTTASPFSTADVVELRVTMQSLYDLQTQAIPAISGGTSGQFLKNNGTVASWSAIASGDIPSLNYLTVANPSGQDFLTMTCVTTHNSGALQINGAASGAAAVMIVGMNGTECQINSTIQSGGTALPLKLTVNGATGFYMDLAPNIGLLTTPLAATGSTVFLPGNGTLVTKGAAMVIGENTYNDGNGTTGWAFASTAPATRYLLYNGGHTFATAVSGTVGTPATFTTLLQLNSSGAIAVMGATPRDYVTTQKQFAVPTGFAITSEGTLSFYQNCYYNNATSTLRYSTTAAATVMSLAGGFSCSSAPSGTVDTDITNVNIFRALVNTNVIVGAAALATTATVGFLWIPSCPGAPTGAATAAFTNAAGFMYDSTNNKIYVRCGGTWRSTAVLT